MSASIAIAAGDAAGMNDLRDALARARVVFIADPAPIAELATALANPKFSCGERVIAHGRQAIAGKDGYFEPAFHAGLQAGHVSEDGRMDFFDRELLKSFDCDACIGQLHGPVPGIPGKRVDGVEIRVQPVRASKLRVGANLRLGPDGRVYTTKSGVVLYVPEKSIDLTENHIHKADVDMRSGNLDMRGSLVVNGSVQRLFQVRASGDVDVRGGVDGGSVFAAGSVRIGGLVRGGESGMVCAEGNVTARNAEAAHILAGGALKLENAVNSELVAATIHIARSMRGGSALAESALVVQDAGAAHGTVTLLAAAVPVERPVLDLHANLQAAKVQRALRHTATGVRGDGERSKGGKLERQRRHSDQAELARRTATAERRQQLLPSAHVHITGKGNAGVAIQIGAHTLVLDKEVHNTRFVYDPRTHGIRTER